MKAMNLELVLIGEAERLLTSIDVTKISGQLFYLKPRIIQDAKGFRGHTKRVGREADRKALSRGGVSFPLIPVIGMKRERAHHQDRARICQVHELGDDL